MLPLSPEDLHHAVNVLRLRVGETVEVFEPGGTGWQAEITSVESRVSAELLAPIAPSAVPAVTLVQGVAKGDKMDAIVRQAVEIGAGRIIPLVASRCVVRLDAAKGVARQERWRRIAKSAAEQAHRDTVPEVELPTPVHDFVRRIAEFDAVVVLWEDVHGAGLAEVLADALAGSSAGATPGRTPSVAIVVGPEGGFSAAEVDLMVTAGARVAGLGPHILRTETAAVVGVALVTHLLVGHAAESLA